jgi:hypothetical protein
LPPARFGKVSASRLIERLADAAEARFCMRVTGDKRRTWLSYDPPADAFHDF